LPAIISAGNSFAYPPLYTANHKEFYKSQLYWYTLHELAKFLI